MQFGKTKVWMVHPLLLTTSKSQWKKAWRIARRIKARTGFLPTPFDESELRKHDSISGLNDIKLLRYARCRLDDRNRIDSITCSPEANLVASKLIDKILSEG